MGKLREESTKQTGAIERAKTAAPKSAKPGFLGPFLANFVRADRYKPTQGKHARLWTSIGLGVIAAAGLIQLYNYHLSELDVVPRYVVPTVIAVVAGWLIWRIVEYPPFADFLIATEAEMNKVSWTSKDDLVRATIVVLFTVTLLALFLFAVDFLWVVILKFINVLQDYSTSAFGSQAG
jgi:preprotein translocase subunit SecE